MKKTTDVLSACLAAFIIENGVQKSKPFKTDDRLQHALWAQMTGTSQWMAE